MRCDVRACSPGERAAAFSRALKGELCRRSASALAVNLRAKHARPPSYFLLFFCCSAVRKPQQSQTRRDWLRGRYVTSPSLYKPRVK